MKRLLLAFTAVALIISLAIPTVAFAQDRRIPKPPDRFDLTLTPQSIDQPSISIAPWPQANPAGANSWPIFDLINGNPTTVGWVVNSRTIYGTVNGDATGSFTFTYGGVLDTLQSGSIQGIIAIVTSQGTVYLSAQGTSDTAIKNTYTFNEIRQWCQGVGISVDMFFANFYGDTDLIGAPIEQMYGSILPLLPKTLTDILTGTGNVESGTGVYAAIHGSAKIKTAGNQPIILSVYPNQHVNSISGALTLTGFRAIDRGHVPQIDLGNIKDNIKNWLGNRPR